VGDYRAFVVPFVEEYAQQLSGSVARLFAQHRQQSFLKHSATHVANTQRRGHGGLNNQLRPLNWHEILQPARAQTRQRVLLHPGRTTVLFLSEADPRV
jgi:hypothetical protein